MHEGKAVVGEKNVGMVHRKKLPGLCVIQQARLNKG